MIHLGHDKQTSTSPKNNEVSKPYCALEQENMKEENKLEELRRKASTGEKAHKRGESTPIKDDDAPDKFFSNIAKEVGKASSDQ